MHPPGKPQPRYPELLDGGYLAFGDWLLSRASQMDVRLQIRPKRLRSRTLLFFHVSQTHRRAFHLETNHGIVQLRWDYNLV